MSLIRGSFCVFPELPLPRPLGSIMCQKGWQGLNAKMHCGWDGVACTSAAPQWCLVALGGRMRLRGCPPLLFFINISWGSSRKRVMKRWAKVCVCVCVSLLQQNFIPNARNKFRFFNKNENKWTIRREEDFPLSRLWKHQLWISSHQ